MSGRRSMRTTWPRFVAIEALTASVETCRPSIPLGKKKNCKCFMKLYF